VSLLGGLLAVVLVGVGFYVGVTSGSEVRGRSWLGSLLPADELRSDAAEVSSGGPAETPSMKPAPGDNAPGSDTPPGAPSGDSERPTEPVRAGAPLGSVLSPPERTLSAIGLPDAFDGGSFAITFQPYGWGPGGLDGGRIVILVTAAAADAGAAGLPDLTDRNAIVEVDPSVSDVVTAGGSYNGTLRVRSDAEGRGVLLLERVTPEP
jgi:hypothetical protein